MIKREAKFCTALGKWWDNEGYKWFAPCGMVIEAKVSTGKKPFNLKSGFKPHQLPTMSAYKHKPMHWKISDMDTISTKHYDISCTNGETIYSFIAIMWVRRGNKKFYLIDPDTIQGEKDSMKSSITEERASILALHTFEIK